jgi:tetratricopeptide (TPR) repeat protein/tRNA A-37 threonylcarbamoyl transferase component Bud32
MSEIAARLKSALADRYTIEHELGSGGMATVYLAHDPKHDRRVAIKVMSEEVAQALGPERFLREIKTAAKLKHPNILPLYDSGEAGGILYYVMPHVEGGTLRDRLEQDGQLPIEAALEVAREVADALGHAHAHGFVHRDIKPENILFLSGRPVVADFGIVSAADPAAEGLTLAGMPLGTPAYMSPEQAFADPVDGRSDIYSLGCVLYEMLTGNTPFEGATARELMARHTTDAITPTRNARPAVPEIVDRTVVKALAKDPADRFQTAGEFADALAGRAAVLRARSYGGIVPRLLRPRALGIVGVYAVAAISAWLATEILVDRLALSPHLPDFVLAVLGFLLPAAAVVAYVLGDGARWRAAQTAGVSANVAVAILALVVLFGGKDLGAATVAVTVTDEDGNTVERVIPKAEFRKRIALFYFDADPSDSTARWLGYGLVAALSIDLFQDMYIDQRVPLHFRDRLREAGFRHQTDVPLTLKRQIAAEQFREQFVTGRVETEGDEIVVTMSLYDTESGALISEHMARGTDPLELVDHLAEGIAGTIEVPEGYAGQIRDMPASELLTTSRPAFDRYSRAQHALWVEDDWPTAARLLEEAVREDSTFAAAQFQLFVTYVFQNRGQEAIAPLQAAMDHAYRLPERGQNSVKAEWYGMRQEYDKAYAVIEMNAELFPEDVTALQQLALIQVLRDQRHEAIATYERILELDPQQHDFLREIGGLNKELGEYDRALDAYNRFAELNPNDERAFIDIGDLQSTLGNHQEARAALERAVLIDPANVGTAVQLAGLELTTGAFDAALQQYEDALAGARTGVDSVIALEGLVRYYRFRGRLGEALGYREQQLAAAAAFAPPIQVMMGRLRSVDDYVAAGDTARAFRLLDSLGRRLQPPFDRVRAIGQLDLALALEDADQIDSAAAAVEGLIERLSVEIIRPLVAYARGRAHFLRGEFREAIVSWEQERRRDPSDWSISRQLGEAYRGLGELERAEQLILEAQRVSPASPRTHYELALVYAEMGRHDDAVASLRRALEVWSNADPHYVWARRARDKLAELEGR